MADHSNLVPYRGTTDITLSQPASRLCSNRSRSSSSLPGGFYRLFAQDAALTARRSVCATTRVREFRIVEADPAAAGRSILLNQRLGTRVRTQSR
jgi:hypothetical protein